MRVLSTFAAVVLAIGCFSGCTTDVTSDALTIADNDVDSAVTYGTPTNVASERF